MDRQVDTLSFDPAVTNAFWERYTGDRETKYVEYAARLISHNQSGIDSQSIRLDSSGFKWNGQQYASTAELYQSIQETVVTRCPLKGKDWFQELCSNSLTDPDTFRYLITSPMTLRTWVDVVKSKYEEATDRSYNDDILTPEDSLYLASLTTGF